MCKFKGDMVVGDISTGCGKAVGSQEFFNREVGKLHYSRTTIVNDSDQTRASGQHRVFMVFPPPVRVHFRDLCFSRIEVIRKKFSKLLDTEWPNGNCETLQESMRVVPTWSLDFLQYALVSLVQRFGQLLERAPDA